MKCIVYKRPDDGVSIVFPNERLFREGKTIEAFRARAEQANPALKTYSFIGFKEKEDIPTNREFRNQWRVNGGKVEVDPTLEVEERWRRIRKERDERLKESDSAILRVQETSPGSVADWKLYRQALRDVPSQPDPKNINWPEKPE